MQVGPSSPSEKPPKSVNMVATVKAQFKCFRPFKTTLEFGKLGSCLVDNGGTSVHGWLRKTRSDFCQE